MSNYGKKMTRRTAKHGSDRHAGRSVGHSGMREAGHGAIRTERGTTRRAASTRGSASMRRAAHTAVPTVRSSVSTNADSVVLPGGILLSRRQFLFGAAGLAALVVAGGVGVSLANSASAHAQDIPILDVSEKSVANSEDYEYYEDYSKEMKLTGSVALPYGTLVWANDNDVAFCLLPTATGSPLASIGIIDLQSLGWGTLLTHAVGESEGYEIYDVRGTSSGIVWTEADILDGNWRVYAAAFSGRNGVTGSTGDSGATGAGSSGNAAHSAISLPDRESNYDASSLLGTPVLIAEGGPEWETPTITAWGNYAYWQELPKAAGTASNENSLLKRYVFGASASGTETVYESPGRMACALSATQGGIVFAPRVEAMNVYYQLTYIDGQTAKVVDRLILPASMRPVEISYGKTGFSFSFDGIYSYGGGIADLGTYTPKQAPSITFATALENAMSEIAADHKTSKDQLTEDELAEAELRAQTAVTDAYNECEWFRFARAPYCPPAWCGTYFMVKSSSAIVGADLMQNWYFALPVENGAPDYGDFLACEGTCQSIVAYTQINYTPINGETIVECRLKIWELA